MPAIHFHPLPTAEVQALRAGGPDAYGNPPERVRAEGHGNPCRHCLNFVPEGAEMLILAHRPFDALQPYAETGPIFLCAECAPWDSEGQGDRLPPQSRFPAQGLHGGPAHPLRHRPRHPKGGGCKLRVRPPLPPRGRLRRCPLGPQQLLPVADHTGLSRPRAA